MVSPLHISANINEPKAATMCILKFIILALTGENDVLMEWVEEHGDTYNRDPHGYDKDDWQGEHFL